MLTIVKGGIIKARKFMSAKESDGGHTSPLRLKEEICDMILCAHTRVYITRDTYIAGTSPKHSLNRG